MEQQIAQLHMERDDLARSKQGLLAEFSIMNKKYVSIGYFPEQNRGGGFCHKEKVG